MWVVIFRILLLYIMKELLKDLVMVWDLGLDRNYFKVIRDRVLNLGGRKRGRESRRDREKSFFI